MSDDDGKKAPVIRMVDRSNNPMHESPFDLLANASTKIKPHHNFAVVIYGRHEVRSGETDLVEMTTDSAGLHDLSLMGLLHLSIDSIIQDAYATPGGGTDPDEPA